MITHCAILNNGLEIRQYRGRTSNIYCISFRDRGETILADCGVPSDIPGLLQVLHALPPLKRVVATHFHVDHITGWFSLEKAFPEAEIWFHRDARPLVDGSRRIPVPSPAEFFGIIYPCARAYGYIPSLEDLLKGGLYGTPLLGGFPARNICFFPDQERDPIPEFTTIHTPGHRPDSVSFLHRESGIFLTGDFLLSMHGQLVVNPYVYCREVQHDSVEKIRRLAGIKYIYAGHGRVLPYLPEALKMSKVKT